MSEKMLPLTSFKVKDFSVSGEEFMLVYDKKFQLYKTTPQPSEDKLPDYYQSEDYVSHTDAKRNIIEKLYHLIRKITLKQKLKLIDSFKTERKMLLDIGCGTGDFLKIAAEHQWKVLGIEPNLQARQIANSKTNNMVFDNGKLDDLKPASFDIITLWHVLEHLPNLDEQITKFKNLLKPNGRLVIAVPNFKSYDAHYYKSYWAAFDVPRHLWHFSQESMSLLFKPYNMIVSQKKPMYFDAFYVSLLSEKYLHGHQYFLKAFWVGLKSNLKAWHTKEYSSIIYILKNKQN